MRRQADNNVQHCTLKDRNKRWLEIVLDFDFDFDYAVSKTMPALLESTPYVDVLQWLFFPKPRLCFREE
jgi:hypothetical protein